MIKLNMKKPRDEKRQIAYFTIDGYEFTDGSVPVEFNTDTKVLAWLKKNEDRYMFLILQRVYRDGNIWADWQRYKTEKNTELAAMRKWIKVGHRNEDGTVIEKQPWHSTHPKGLALKADIAKATTVVDVKKILGKMTDNF